MIDSVLTTLGVGSGIDTRKLTADLVASARAGRQTAIDTRAASNSARLGALATLSSDLKTVAEGTATRVRTLADGDIVSFVDDLVESVNSLRGQLNDATRVGALGEAGGSLTGDAGARALGRALSSLAGTSIAGTTTIARLADIGISTARDGTLSVDHARLASVIASDLPGVKALLGVGTPVATGIARTLAELRTAMTGTQGALTRSKSVYDRASAAIVRDRTRLDSDMTALNDRLVGSFTAMDKQVALIKASQAYLTQQIAAWNKP